MGDGPEGWKLEADSSCFVSTRWSPLVDSWRFLGLHLTVELPRLIYHCVKLGRGVVGLSWVYVAVTRLGFFQLLFPCVRRQLEAVLCQRSHLLLKCPTSSHATLSLFTQTFPWSSGSDPSLSSLTSHLRFALVKPKDAICYQFICKSPSVQRTAELSLCLCGSLESLQDRTAPIFNFLTLPLPCSLLQSLLVLWLILHHQICKPRSLPGYSCEALALLHLCYSKEQTQ